VQPENNHPTQLFKQVLLSPATLTDAHIDQLRTLLYSFPQCGVLHAIQARSLKAEDLTQAAAWFGNSELLEKVVKAPQALAVVTSSEVIIRSRRQLKPVQQQEANEVEPSIENTPEEIAQPTFTATEPQAPPLNEKVSETEVKPEQRPGVANPETSKETKFAPPIFKEEPFDETQMLIVENLAANDYFVFDKAFADRNQMQPEVVKPEVIVETPKPVVTLAKPAGDVGGVTRYHDDKMPYSFLWWLDKTRNKHSQVYQPFANPVVNNNTVSAVPDNSIREIIDDRTKEEEIVERFIQDEPQIRPPSGDKLDNENKAKHSVEDQEELITETLARIYADQMLYSKAIAAYKILMLKNPEKRRYFASQIENLEKKIN
jgi:hypothetical protein